MIYLIKYVVYKYYNFRLDVMESGLGGKVWCDFWKKKITEPCMRCGL